MKRNDVSSADVQQVYNGPEAQLWELIMGEQIHAGGMASSMALAEVAGIKKGMKGLDLCCCLGAGMRLLTRSFGVEMSGVDFSDTMIQEARRRTEAEGLSDVLSYKEGDVMNIPHENEEVDFVWGEDAWCYVLDKKKLIQEAHRVLKPGGTIAFTDWVEGSAGLSDEEAARINTFMKFPYMESVDGYRSVLEEAGFQIKEAVEIEFEAYVNLYLTMLEQQLTSDALRILGWNMELFQGMGGEMHYMRDRVHEKKMGRGRFVAIKMP
jgi:sarcosine/dimethylglycine N-methyltransferase